jgi:hypothetical protein
LNKQPQDRQGMLSHGWKDHMMNTRKFPNGCGKWGRKRVHRLGEDEGIGQSKLRAMGMMGKWMEVGTKLGIGVKQPISFPLGACWEGSDDWRHFGDKKPTWSNMLILNLTYLV